jgi:NAD binding domain of 6-phosphogluconate dehydrogenase
MARAEFPQEAAMAEPLELAGPVGFIGLGIMGSAMRAHLLGAGHRVIGYDVSPAACDQHLAQDGADNTSSVHAVLRALGSCVTPALARDRGAPGPARGGAPGTVRSVHPVGWLPAGSTVVVTGVLVPTNGGADHHHHHTTARPPAATRAKTQGNGQGTHHGRGKGRGQGGQPPEGDTSLAAAGIAGDWKDNT